MGFHCSQHQESWLRPLGNAALLCSLSSALCQGSEGLNEERLTSIQKVKFQLDPKAFALSAKTNSAPVFTINNIKPT